MRDLPGIFKIGFVEDPWGTRIEVVQDPELLGLHHIHMRGPDTEAIFTWLLAEVRRPAHPAEGTARRHQVQRSRFQRHVDSRAARRDDAQRGTCDRPHRVALHRAARRYHQRPPDQECPGHHASPARFRCPTARRSISPMSPVLPAPRSSSSNAPASSLANEPPRVHGRQCGDAESLVYLDRMTRPMTCD